MPVRVTQPHPKTPSSMLLLSELTVCSFWIGCGGVASDVVENGDELVDQKVNSAGLGWVENLRIDDEEGR